MSYQGLSGKARQDILKQAKRQIFRERYEFAEDTRPVLSAGMSPKSLYNQLNKELFEGKLPDIPVEFNSRLRRTLGKAYYRIDSGGSLVPTRIEIRKKHHWTARFIRKVMTHEMCHIWAYHFHNEDKHGRKFWKKMSELGYPKTHDWNDSMSCERDIYC